MTNKIKRLISILLVTVLFQQYSSSFSICNWK